MYDDWFKILIWDPLVMLITTCWWWPLLFLGMFLLALVTRLIFGDRRR